MRRDAENSPQRRRFWPPIHRYLHAFGYFLQGSKGFQSSLAFPISPLAASFGLEPHFQDAGLLCGDFFHPLGTPATSIKMSLSPGRIRQARQGLQPCTSVVGKLSHKSPCCQGQQLWGAGGGTEYMINLACSTREVMPSTGLKAEPRSLIKFRKHAQ